MYISLTQKATWFSNIAKFSSSLHCTIHTLLNAWKTAAIPYPNPFAFRGKGTYRGENRIKKNQNRSVVYIIAHLRSQMHELATRIEMLSRYFSEDLPTHGFQSPSTNCPRIRLWITYSFAITRFLPPSNITPPAVGVGAGVK